MVGATNPLGRDAVNENDGRDVNTDTAPGNDDAVVKSEGREPLKLNVGREVPTLKLNTFEGICTPVVPSVAVVGSNEGIAVL